MPKESASTSLSGRERSFSESEKDLLDLFALSAEIEQLAVVDELTGVFNRRGLLTLGAREVERARRLGRPLAMLFVDLDHFKALNDECPHEAVRGPETRDLDALIRRADEAMYAAKQAGRNRVVALAS